MAKLRSIIKILGTLDDLTFYKGKQGYLIRTKGGVSANRIKNDPAFERTRENGTEFGESASAGKLLRRSILDMLTDAKDGLVTSRLTQTMSKVKNFDSTSPRGERTVAIGLTTPEGRARLNGFNFNNRAILSSVLLAGYSLDTATGEVNIPNFVPMQNLYAPEGATHVSLSAGFLNIDFDSEANDLETSLVLNLPIDTTSTNVVLTPAAVPAGAGTQMYFLKIQFFQEVNAVQYSLNNGAYNTLQIIDVL